MFLYSSVSTLKVKQKTSFMVIIRSVLKNPSTCLSKFQKRVRTTMFVLVRRGRVLVHSVLALAFTFCLATAHVGTAIAAGADSFASRPLCASTGFPHDHPVLDLGLDRFPSSEGSGDLGLTRIVPTYDQRGLLWGRRYDPDARFWSGWRPAIVVMHGGGGQNVRFLERARWSADQG
jgi:hypothetical protein